MIDPTANRDIDRSMNDSNLNSSRRARHIQEPPKPKYLLSPSKGRVKPQPTRAHDRSPMQPRLLEKPKKSVQEDTDNIRFESPKRKAGETYGRPPRPIPTEEP